MMYRREDKQTNWMSLQATPMRLFVLALCLLLSQALGFMHGIVHLPHQHQHQHQYDPNTHQHATQHEAHAHEEQTSWTAGLFAGHGDESTCQVFDQLSQGSALLSDAVTIAQLTLNSFFLDTYRGATPPYQRSLVQARGPPAVRDFIVAV